MAGFWKYDPVAYFFIGGVDEFLRKPGRAGVSMDLLDRLHETLAKAQEGDNSLETSRRRVSWCCYVVGDKLLEMLGHAPHPAPAALRPPMTEETCASMEKVFVDIDQIADVDTAEYLMSEDEQKRKAAQLWAEKVKKLKLLSNRATRIVNKSRTCMSQVYAPDDVAQVGEEFVQFLIEADTSRDDLVKIAESLVEIHV